MAHDAQIINVALHLAELGAQRVDFIAVAESDHPALQFTLQQDTHPAGENGQLIKAAQLVVGIVFEHLPAGEKRLRRNDAIDRLTAQLMRRLAQSEQAAGGMIYHFDTPVMVNYDHPFVYRLHHRLLLAHQQADFPRLQRENLLLNAAGEVPGEDKQRNQQQHRGDKDIDDFFQRDAVEIAGEVADGNNTDDPARIVENRRFAAQGNPQSPFADGGGAFPLQHRLVIAANQPRADPFRVDRMKQMHASPVANDNKAGVAVGGDILHKRFYRQRVFTRDLLA